MCGLFGLFSSTITLHEKEMFRQLGRISALRGTDSTGMIVGSRKKKNGHKYNIDIKKDVMNSSAFFDDWSVNKSINTDHAFLLAGHTRDTTAGAINFNNAHPIIEGNIVLCHNGTIKKWVPAKKDEETSSDSRIFARKISDLGVDRALREAEEGDYAITFVDRQLKTFNIARKPGRTLFCVFSKDGEVLMWASEHGFLELILNRNGIRHNWSKIELFPPHKQFIWKFTDKPDKASVREINLSPAKIITHEKFDYTKYATKVEDEPTHDDRAAYDAWMEKHSKTEKDWIPYEGDVYGDPSLAEEIWNDPPAETLSGETDTEDSQKSAQGQDSGRKKDDEDLSDRFSRSAIAYCKKCKERSSLCKCKHAQYHYPYVWELDSKGRWIDGAAQRATSVPSVGTPPAERASLGYLTPGISTPEHDKKLQDYLKNWHPERSADDDSTYIGYLRQTMSPSVATEKLKDGCSICGHQSDWKSTVYWYSDFGHVCFDCKDKTIEYFGNVSTYKSRYTEGEPRVIAN